MTDVVMPDPRRVKRAVRWGVVRTAGGAVGWVFGILVFLMLVGLLFEMTFDHRNRFERIVGSAFVASQPDYEWSLNTSWAAMPSYGNTMTIYGQLRGVDQAWGPVTERSMYQNALGHLGLTIISPEGPITEAIRRGRPTADQTRELLAGLPVRSRAMAIVELRNPLDWDGKSHVFPTVLPEVGGLFWLEPPYAEQSFVGRAVRHPLTWPHYRRSETTFNDWVDDLRDSDAPNLEPFGLPTISELREIRSATAVYAYLTKAVDIAELAKITSRTDVVSVRLVDVRLPVF